MTGLSDTSDSIINSFVPESGVIPAEDLPAVSRYARGIVSEQVAVAEPQRPDLPDTRTGDPSFYEANHGEGPSGSEDSSDITRD